MLIVDAYTVNQQGGNNAVVVRGGCNTLTAATNNGGTNRCAVVYGVCSYDSNAMKSDNPNSGFYEAETSRTLDNNGGNPACNQGGMMIVQDDVQYRVRRLTPLECERLQGFPDGWTDIGEWTDGKGKLRKTTDGARYKALGNSIALPYWKWMLRNMAEYLPEGATLGSLFDGIGGFPLIWQQIHGKGTARWASEIEEFCIAVTKYHFGED